MFERVSESVSERLWNRSLILTTLVVALVSSISVWWAWQTSDSLVARLAVLGIAPPLVAALISYSLRTFRFHYFLRRSGIPITLRETTLIQAIGFALGVTPGHVGEVFKLYLIRERTGTPVIQSAPLLVLDRFTEGGGFMLLAVGSAVLLPALRNHLPIPMLVLLGLGATIVFAVTFRRWSSRVVLEDSAFARSALGRRVVPHLQTLWRGLQTSFTLGQVIGGLAFAVPARFADGLVVLFAAGLMGVRLELPEAVFVLAVSGLAGGISLLPAGTGAVETTMTALLVVLGASWSSALSITLLARLCTLWLWVALGLIVAFLSREPRARAYFFGSSKG